MYNGVPVPRVAAGPAAPARRPLPPSTPATFECPYYNVILTKSQQANNTPTLLYDIQKVVDLLILL